MVLVLNGLHALGLGVNHAAAQVPRGLLGNFQFNENAVSSTPAKSTFTLHLTEFREKALYLNGRYGYNGEGDGYRAVWKMPQMDYNQFTIVLRFKAEEFTSSKSNLITGGTSYRWFCLRRSPAGCLSVCLNNQDLCTDLESLTLEANQWYTLACSLNLSRQKVQVSMDGGEVHTIELPPGTTLRVVGSERDLSDREWTFTNYSNGQTFHGLIDEFRLYGRSVAEEQLQRLSR